MAAIDTSARLGAIQVPTLCVAGELDKSSPPEIVAAIAEQIAGARFAVIPGRCTCCLLSSLGRSPASSANFSPDCSGAACLLTFDRDEDAAAVDTLDTVDIERRM